MSDTFNKEQETIWNYFRGGNKAVHTDLKGRNGNVVYVSRKWNNYFPLWVYYVLL